MTPTNPKAPDIHGPIGELCADCGKPIGMLEASRYVKTSSEDIGRTYHLMCGQELHAPTVERCAEVADKECSENPIVAPLTDAAYDRAARTIAAAIRSLVSDKQGGSNDWI